VFGAFEPVGSTDCTDRGFAPAIPSLILLASMKILLLGGSRFVGKAVARALLHDGHHLTLFNRGSNQAENPPGVTQFTGDRGRPDDLARAAALHFDLVVDTSGYTRHHVELAADAFAGRTSHYLYLSTGAVYAESETFPLTESSPLGPMPLWGSYGEEKLGGERAIEERAAGHAFEFTHLRATYVLGAGNYADRENFLFARIAQQAPILLPDGGNALIQFVDALDLGAAFAAVVRSSQAGNTAYNIASPEAITLRGLVQLAGELAGTEPNLLPFSMHDHGICDRPYHLADAPFPFANEHFLFDCRKLQTLMPDYPWRDTRAMLEGFRRAHTEPFRIRRSPSEERILQTLAPAIP